MIILPAWLDHLEESFSYIEHHISQVSWTGVSSKTELTFKLMKLLMEFVDLYTMQF